MHPGGRGERGAAMILALLAMLVMLALGTALILATSAETKITRNFRNHTEALYAADAVLERVLDEALALSDWNALLTGAARSTFVDGAPSGTRQLADGRAIDLDELLNDANCHKVSTCSNADMDRITSDRPWGLNNPRWQLYAWGALDNIVGTATINSPFYVVVMVADDPSDCDDNPLVDGGAVTSCLPAVRVNPGTGAIAMRATALGPFGARKTVEVTVERTDAIELESGGDSSDYNVGTGQAGIRVLSWREVRQP